MTRNDIIKHYGSITAACEALSYSRYAIWRWKKGVPLRATANRSQDQRRVKSSEKVSQKIK